MFPKFIKFHQTHFLIKPQHYQARKETFLLISNTDPWILADVSKNLDTNNCGVGPFGWSG
jgi:hypothetical protein